MKSFRNILSEVSEPKAGDEKHFKDKHITVKKDHPVADDNVFKGGTKKAPKRIADHDAGEDAAVYEAMDPVNKKAALGKFKDRADKDIDNDGDVDSSDKYLHARRKAVTKAIHKEEAELDEAGIKTPYGTTKTNKYGGSSGKSIIPKRGTKAYDAWRAKNDEMHKKRVAMWKNEEAELDLSDFTIEEWEEFMESAEYDQLDEISKKTLGSYVKKASDDMADNAYTLGARDPLRKPGSWNKAFKRRKGIEKATDRLTKEEVEDLEEISSDLKSRYAKKAQSSLKRATTYRAKAQDDASKASANIDRANSGDRSVNVNKQYDRIDRADAKAAKHDKTIAKRTAGLKRANEEVEDLEEISRDTARSYIRKAMAHKTTGETPKKDRSAGVNLAGKKAYDIGGKAKVSAKESAKWHLTSSESPLKKESVEQIDEAIHRAGDRVTWRDHSSGKNLTGTVHNANGGRMKGGSLAVVKVDGTHMGSTAKIPHKHLSKLDEVTDQERLSARKIQRDAQTARHGIARKPGESMVAYLTRAKKHKEKMQKEEVEQLDELSPNTLHSYVKKANRSANKNFSNAIAQQTRARKGVAGADEKRAQYSREFDKRATGLDRAKARLTKEEVEQLDELSPNTLHSYIKGAGKDLAKRSRMSGYDDKRGNYADGDKNRKKANKRLAGITSASGRLADKANMAENAWEEVPMMMRQLQFIAYAAEEIMDYLDIGVDPEEWFQNKLAGVHSSMMSLHAYMEGDKRMMSAMDYDMYGEEFELDESITKMSHGRLKFHLNTNTPHGSYSNDEMKAERDRRLKAGEGEAYKKAKASLSEVTQSAVKKTVTYTGSDGKSHTRNVPIKRIDRDEHGEEKIRESAELDEAFKVGMLKLNDGGSVILKKEDVDVLNGLFKNLSSTNRKKMESTAMKDKNGFNEILSFAREAIQ